MNRFNEVQPLIDDETGMTIAHVSKHGLLIVIDDSVCTASLSFNEAVALREWLDKVLPAQNTSEHQENKDGL